MILAIKILIGLCLIIMGILYTIIFISIRQDEKTLVDDETEEDYHTVTNIRG